MCCLFHKSRNKDYKNEYRQNKLEIRLDFLRHFYSASRVDFFNIVIKAPAPFGDAEEEIDKCACGKKNIADYEILAVKNISAADEFNVAPDVVAENAGNAAYEEENSVNNGGFFSSPAEIINAACNEVFKNGNNG